MNLAELFTSHRDNVLIYSDPSGILDSGSKQNTTIVLLDFPLTVKAATLILISGRGSAISSPKQGESDFIYNLVKNK